MRRVAVEDLLAAVDDQGFAALVGLLRRGLSVRQEMLLRMGRDNCVDVANPIVRRLLRNTLGIDRAEAVMGSVPVRNGTVMT